MKTILCLLAALVLQGTSDLTLKRITILPTGYSSSITLDDVRARLYVLDLHPANQQRGIRVFDTHKLRQIAWIEWNADSGSVAVQPTTGLLYRSCYEEKRIDVVDPSRQPAVLSIPLPERPGQITISSQANRAYVPLETTIGVIDTEKNLLAPTISVGQLLIGIKVVEDPRTGTLYALGTHSTLILVDVATNKVRKVIDLTDPRWTRFAPGPLDLVLDPATNHLYLTFPWPRNEVVVLDAGQGTVLKHISIGEDPQHIVLDAVFNRLYVTNRGDHTLSVIDANRDVVLGTVPTRDIDSPSSLAVDSTTHRLYVSSSTTGGVGVYDCLFLPRHTPARKK